MEGSTCCCSTFIALAYRIENAERKYGALLEELELTDKQDEIASSLSRGMLQKLSLACAFLREPRVMKALGVSLLLPVERIAACLDEVGIAFLYAPAMHTATKHVPPARREACATGQRSPSSRRRWRNGNRCRASRARA